MFVIEIEFGTPAYDEVLNLRDKILRKPLGLEFTTEEISEEYQQIHLACYNDAFNLLACLVLVIKDENTLKMRQVAVDESQQKKGIGQFLVKESEKWAIENGYIKMVLNARDTAVPFYKKMDYEKHGKQFIEVNIPHYAMRKNLKQR